MKQSKNPIAAYFFPILIVVLTAWVLAALYTYTVFQKDGKWNVSDRQVPPMQIPDGTACTMEAKICPDGSSVGRIGPNCEFAACPGEE